MYFHSILLLTIVSVQAAKQVKKPATLVLSSTQRERQRNSVSGGRSGGGGGGGGGGADREYEEIVDRSGSSWAGSFRQPIESTGWFSSLMKPFQSSQSPTLPPSPSSSTSTSESDEESSLDGSDDEALELNRRNFRQQQIPLGGPRRGSRGGSGAAALVQPQHEQAPPLSVLGEEIQEELLAHEERRSKNEATVSKQNEKDKDEFKETEIIDDGKDEAKEDETESIDDGKDEAKVDETGMIGAGKDEAKEDETGIIGAGEEETREDEEEGKKAEIQELPFYLGPSSTSLMYRTRGSSMKPGSSRAAVKSKKKVQNPVKKGQQKFTVGSRVRYQKDRRTQRVGVIVKILDDGINAEVQVKNKRRIQKVPLAALTLAPKKVYRYEA
eukprot:g1329.t1